MMPIEHPWEEWQEEADEMYSWKWKDNTPKEIKEQYEEWKKYYDKKTKYKSTY